MNNKDLEAGIKLGTTSIGTAIGGPIGGAIGSAVGDIASWIIPDKTLIQRKTSYNQSVDPSMSYSRTDTGKGFSNYTVKEREKASTFGNIMNVASDVIPMAASATGFKGIGLDGIGKMFGGGVEEVAKAPFQIPNVSKLPTMEKIATPFTDKVIGANKDIPMLKTAISSTGNMLSEGVGTINSLFDKFNNTSFDDMIGSVENMIGNNSPNLGTIKKDRMNSYVPKDSFEKGYDSYMEQGSRDYNTGEPFKDEALRLTGGKYKKENENLPNSVDFMRQYGHTDMNRILKYSNGKPNYSRTF